ncbi:FAD-dependent monooxygenase [Mycobacterium sp. ACS4331]|uniref:FAD-dependent monooxygenase n=1 Tax=Mycobacterium sp. ACS4331 TaxID=1834121 RepID=UPI0007FC7A0D|nr:FAD-dependent monooxygenase [Mycobacterium sp. ACS4331]OBF19535.1 pentachlorophenol monooxygenase [Mycobacterium sp. ACS4331]
MSHTPVLIAGAGPVGLTAAIELSRRGVTCRVVDPLTTPPQYAKAVGVQPRTLEVFEAMGVLPEILDAAIPMRGQVVYVNGEKAGEAVLSLPDGAPYWFANLPQYETERILRDELSRRGVVIERGLAVSAFEQDDTGVTVQMSDGSSVRAGYLIGADGAHSTVRKALGLTFDGGAFEEQYLLGDVEVDWSVPTGFVVRSMHQTDGRTDDLLVCVPLPGRKRYRMTMTVPRDLALASADGDGVAHGFEGDRTPDLGHIQAVLDRLSPEPTTARNLRWSSVFRISHRIADAYGRGRVFVAGDAAHIHPPTGGQGMNTGIQDAHNLAWKLALAVDGAAAPGLLDSYDAERRLVGEEVVGRTVQSARRGIGADSDDPEFVMAREAQLLIDYGASPIVNRTQDPVDWRAVAPGRRAPDVRGLTRDLVTGPVRLFSVLTGLQHTLLIHVDGTADVEGVEALADAASRAAHGRLATYLVAAPNADVGDTTLPVLRDTGQGFAAAYGARGTAVYLVRPDGYLSHVADHLDHESLTAQLALIVG